MIFKAFFFRETELARLLGPSLNSSVAVWVPQDHTKIFRKLAPNDFGPRPCIFEVEPWLEKKPEFARFEEAKFGVDYT